MSLNLSEEASQLPHNLQQEATAKLMQRLQQCLQQWPQWQAPLNTPPQLINSLGSGLSHYNFRVRSDTQDFVVRIESAASRELAMSNSDEHYWLATCADFAPTVVWQDDDVLVSQYLHLPHWQAPEQLELMGRTLAKLHQLPVCSSQAPTPLDLIAHTERYWQQLKNLSLAHQPSDQQQQQEQSIQHEQQAESLHAYMLEHIQQTLQQFSQRCICHNDLHASNILIGQQQCVFLDWEYAAINAPGFDLASLAESASLNRAQLQQLVDSYQPDITQQSVLLAEIARYRAIVRYLEWLWLRLRQLPASQQVGLRLRELLYNDGATHLFNC